MINKKLSNTSAAMIVVLRRQDNIFRQYII